MQSRDFRFSGERGAVTRLNRPLPKLPGHADEITELGMKREVGDAGIWLGQCAFAQVARPIALGPCGGLVFMG